MILPEISEFYKVLGEKLKTERIRKNVSQDKMAQHLGLTRASIINLEKGRHRPSIYQLIQISNLLELDYTSFVPYTDTKNKNKGIVQLNDLKNYVTDQEKIEKPALTAISKFLSAIKKTES